MTLRWTVAEARAGASDRRCALLPAAPPPRAPPPPPPPRGGRRPRGGAARAFRIDRRQHMELQWQRQAEHEALLARAGADLGSGRVVAARSLAHLEALLDAAAGDVVLLLVHSRACGVCRDVRASLAEVAAEAAAARAGVRVLEAEKEDEFDRPGEIARLYGVKATPAFLFFVDGALVRRGALPDWPRVGLGGGAGGGGGARAGVQAGLRWGRRALRQALWELVVKNAPSARAGGGGGSDGGGGSGGGPP